jgi:predicted alpha/beta superfamily hydrolase
MKPTGQPASAKAPEPLQACAPGRMPGFAPGIAFPPLSVFLAFLFFTFPALAQPDPRVPADTSLLENHGVGYTFDTLERQAQADGPRYRVYLAVPRKAPPPEGYPVLYLLDGNAVLDALNTKTVLLKTIGESSAPPVLVMIGYVTSARFDVNARTYDYTPPIPEKPRLEDRAGSGRKAGGAEALRDFIVTRLKPEIERKVRIDSRRQGIWGHSYGGLFVLHTLFAHPDDFQRYIAASPSLQWQDGWILREAEAFVARPQTRPLTLLAVSGADESGEKARRNPPSARAEAPQGTPRQRASAPRDALPRLIARLNAGGVSARLILMEGKAHGEMFSLSLEPALRGIAGENP